ncbi:MAG: ArsB/NhaD family transporter [Thermomicrobiales bacterium]
MVLGIVGACLVLTLSRSFGINEGIWTLGGASLLVLAGALPPSEAARTIYDLLGVGIFLAGLFWLSLAAERAGLIEILGNKVVDCSGGDGRLLLVAVVLLASATTAMFSNDGTVVLVTPVVIQLCQRMRVDPLPYAFAVTFVTDTASSIVPVANPVNVLFAERLDLTFGSHIVYLAVPTLAALAVTTIMLIVVMSDRIPRRINRMGAERAESGILDGPARLVGACLLMTAIGYVIAAVAGISPFWITLAGGAIALLPGLIAGRVRLPDVVRVQPPGLYAFVAGLAVIVATVDRQGLLDSVSRLVLSLQNQPGLVRILGIGFGAAVGSNLINNWTMALVLIPPLDAGNAPDALIFAGLFGTDIGPNLTIVGSLATLIWMTQVRRAGLVVTTWTYLRLGLLTTVPALFVAMLALVLMGRIV